ncbi:MAG: hypothetical protein GX624_11110 [Actinobacteria bacterium]|nr:hypothetical protein [Actinomycetota bacterium]
MGVMERPDVENIPGDLDRFLGNFFSRRGWRSEIKYDPAEDRLYLDVRLASARLSGDDRFLSLVEYFARAQDAVLRRRTGLPLQCRMYGSDGSDLTGTLHARGSSYLDDNARGHGMRRRLLLLSFRRRFLWRVLPGAVLWALAFTFLVGVVGVSFDLVLIVAIAALGVQALLLWSTTVRSR